MENLGKIVYKNSTCKMIEDKPSNGWLFLISLSFLSLYIFNIYSYFWTLPTASDPLGYAGNIAWGSTYGYYPWVDRIMVASGIRIVSFFCNPIYIAGPLYIAIINSLMMLLCIIWAWKESGAVASICVGAFWNSSLLLLGWATYIYADQTMSFYSLCALFYYFYMREKKTLAAILLCGLFSALAVLSKITGVATIAYFLIIILLSRSLKQISFYIIGCIAGLLTGFIIFIFCYNIESLINVIYLFFKSNISSNLSLSRHNITAYTEQVLTSLRYFPFICLFIFIPAYLLKKCKFILRLAWFHIFLFRGSSFLPK